MSRAASRQHSCQRRRDTALSASPYALSSFRELVDPSQILFGSDYPFAAELIVEVMAKGLQSFDGFGAGELVAIERGNAARMFPKFSR